jgi:hypothetical protein
LPENSELTAIGGSLILIGKQGVGKIKNNLNRDDSISDIDQ